ncbi:MAG: DNA repair protein RecO [Proteobacteria bacterium]|nr:DNA repair protein RecO [Pseudomonadota bacterium]
MKRGAYKVKAVLLNSVDYAESDRILTFYTEEYGKMSGIAKGARRSRKRFVANIDPLCHSTLLLFHNGKSDLVRIDDATLIDGHGALKADIEKYSIGCYMLELVNEMTREGHALPEVYTLLKDFLGLLDKSGGPNAASYALDSSDSYGSDSDDALLRFFEIKLLSFLGYLPHLNGCVECAEPVVGTGATTGTSGASSDASLYFSPERGGAVCAPCGDAIGAALGMSGSGWRPAPEPFDLFSAARRNSGNGTGGLQPVSTGTVRWLSTAARFDSEKLGRLKTSPVFLKEGERLLGDFIRHQIGRELKTKIFMHKLRGTVT